MVSEILSELSRRGIEIEIAGEKIRLHGLSKDSFDKSLISKIKTYKSEIITFLSGKSGTEVKNRPIWCTRCEHGRYETSETGSQVLWCKLADMAVIEMKKCTRGYWVKNKIGWPITVH